jgi:hypothetical protein
MFKLGDKAAVDSSQGPAVLCVYNLIGRNGQERLDGKHKSLSQDQGLPFIDARNRWCLMEPSTNPVAVQIANHPESVPSGASLYCASNIAQSRPGLCCRHRVRLGEPCRIEEPLRDWPNLADGDTHASVGEVAVQLDRDIEVYEVACAQLPRERGNTMSRLVIHTDARGAGEPIRDDGR